LVGLVWFQDPEHIASRRPRHRRAPRHEWPGPARRTSLVL